MKHSEFWKAVETVHGSAYGRSLAQDLVVPGLGATCVEALAAGVAPREVWHALCAESPTAIRTRVRLECSTDGVRAPRVHRAR